MDAAVDPTTRRRRKLHQINPVASPEVSCLGRLLPCARRGDWPEQSLRIGAADGQAEPKGGAPRAGGDSSAVGNGTAAATTAAGTHASRVAAGGYVAGPPSAGHFPAHAAAAEVDVARIPSDLRGLNAADAEGDAVCLCDVLLVRIPNLHVSGGDADTAADVLAVHNGGAEVLGLHRRHVTSPLHQQMSFVAAPSLYGSVSAYGMSENDSGPGSVFSAGQTRPSIGAVWAVGAAAGGAAAATSPRYSLLAGSRVSSANSHSSTARTSGSVTSRWGIRQLARMLSAGLVSFRQQLARMAEPRSGNLCAEAVAELTRWTSRRELIRAIAQVTDVEIISQSAARSIVCRGRAAGGAEVVIKYTASAGSGEGMAAPATEGLLSRLLVHPNVVRTYAWHLTRVAQEDVSGDAEAALAAAAATEERLRQWQRLHPQHSRQQLGHGHRAPTLPPAPAPALAPQQQPQQLLQQLLQQGHGHVAGLVGYASTPGPPRSAGSSQSPGRRQYCAAQPGSPQRAALARPPPLLCGPVHPSPGRCCPPRAACPSSSESMVPSARESSLTVATRPRAAAPTGGAAAAATHDRAVGGTNGGGTGAVLPLPYGSVTAAQTSGGGGSGAATPTAALAASKATVKEADLGRSGSAVSGSITAAVDAGVKARRAAAAGGALSSPVPPLSMDQVARAWCEIQDMLMRLNARPGDYLARIVMEAADKGSLLTAIRQGVFSGERPSRLHTLLLTARDVARGMAHLHRHAVIHGDLKPSNVLLRSDPTDPRGFIALVSDFGLSRIAPRGSLEGTDMFGTVSFMAPEVFSGCRYPSSDVYSFGVLLWQMLGKLPPWPGLRNVQVMMGVLQGDLKLSAPLGTYPPLAALLERCLARSHTARPTFDAVARELESLLSHVEKSLRPEGRTFDVPPAGAAAAPAPAPGPATPATALAAASCTQAAPQHRPLALALALAQPILPLPPLRAVAQQQNAQSHQQQGQQQHRGQLEERQAPEHRVQQGKQQQQQRQLHRAVVAAAGTLALAVPTDSGAPELVQAASGRTGVAPDSSSTFNHFTSALHLQLGEASGLSVAGSTVLAETADVDVMEEVPYPPQVDLVGGSCRQATDMTLTMLPTTTIATSTATASASQAREWTLAVSLIASSQGSYGSLSPPQAAAPALLLSPRRQLLQPQPPKPPLVLLSPVHAAGSVAEGAKAAVAAVRCRSDACLPGGAAAAAACAGARAAAGQGAAGDCGSARGGAGGEEDSVRRSEGNVLNSGGGGCGAGGVQVGFGSTFCGVHEEIGISNVDVEADDYRELAIRRCAAAGGPPCRPVQLLSSFTTSSTAAGSQHPSGAAVRRRFSWCPTTTSTSATTTTTTMTHLQTHTTVVSGATSAPLPAGWNSNLASPSENKCGAAQTATSPASRVVAFAGSIASAVEEAAAVAAAMRRDVSPPPPTTAEIPVSSVC